VVQIYEREGGSLCKKFLPHVATIGILRINIGYLNGMETTFIEFSHSSQTIGIIKSN